MKWKKIEAGCYTSDDEKFDIYKTWSRSHGNHWEVRNNHRIDEIRANSTLNGFEKRDEIRKAQYHVSTLAEAKELAERLSE